MATIVATVGAADANCYETEAEADAYFDARLPLDPPWVVSGANNARALIMGTRILDAMSVARTLLRRDGRGGAGGTPYYITTRAWTGLPASTTQALAWPRKGMYDRLGRAIPEDVIPQELKDALSEFAGQLLGSDRTADDQVAVRGITSIRAGSVALTFKEAIEAQVLPDAVVNLMPASWFTDELITYAGPSMVFEAT